MSEKMDLEKIGAQVYAVLKNLSDEDYNKISERERKIYEQFKEPAEKITIDLDKNLREQDICEEAIDIIYSVVIRFLLSEEDREKTIKKLKEKDELIKENNYIEKDIFKKKREKAKEECSQNMIIEVKNKNFFERIFDKIKNIFKKMYN